MLTVTATNNAKPKDKPYKLADEKGLYLFVQASGNNNGRLHLSKKWLYNQGWTYHENNSKARNELIERGLIVQTK
jgi:hypothetical protein